MKKLFNDGWQFAEMPLGELPSESDFKPTDIPHDWQIRHASELYKTSDGWYKKTFSAEKTAGRVYSLRFEGVYMDSEIYLNGEKIFEWKYGYTTFDVPLSLKEGENEIKVRVRYQNPNTRWYSGAGIFRNVWLRETGANRFMDDGTYVVSYPEGDSWLMEIDSEFTAEVPVTIRHTLYDADGEQVGLVKTHVPVGNDRISQSLQIRSPELWSPERPYLYSLLSEIIVGEETVDSVYERVGFKYCRFDKDKGFFLNGVNMKLNGVCMHHDLGCLGSAFKKEADRRQILKLKEMGVNAIRTSHNPPAPEFMDLCDELGIMVDSELLDMWQDKKTTYDYARFFDDWHERDVRSWIRRDRNRVSIIMWSIGNEIGDTNDIPRGADLTKELSRCVRIDDYKNTRPITIGSNHMRWQGAQNCAEELGTVGYNYLESIYDRHHAEHPNWVIYGSETASTIQSRGIYHFPASVVATTYDDLQCSSLMNCATGWGAPTAEYNITEDRNRKYSLGQFIWTGFDYIGEPTPYSTRNSYFGHIDTAGFEKDTFYAYRAEWNKAAKPFVHLFPNWDWNEGQLIDIFAFSNCESVEVFVNGETLGREEYNHTDGHTLSGRWQTEYKKGEIKAVGYIGGKPVCEDIRRTPTDPARLVLEPDKRVLSANGEDIAFVSVTALDRDGNTVDNARNRVNIFVSGAARLLGADNGDSTDVEEYRSNSRRLFGGRLAFALGSTFDPGEIKIRITSPGLPDEELTLKAISARPREGVSCADGITEFVEKTDISVRKIELSATCQKITPGVTCRVSYKILPENADPAEIKFKAVSSSGVETNLCEIISCEGGATVLPKGDGSYRLRAYCRNGTAQDEVISELEMENSGFGPASYDPYSGVIPASLATNGGDFKADMGGGVLALSGGELIFKNTDFGNIGSDEITIGVYTYNENVIPIVLSVDGEPLMTLDFQAKNEWNTYKYNTFKLPETLKGAHDISLKFPEELRFKGFGFSSPRRLGAELYASTCDEIYGDSFEKAPDMIKNIGNNVSIVFRGVDLGGGADRMIITGRTRHIRDTVRVSLSGLDDINVEFEGTEGIVRKAFDIEKAAGRHDVTLIFLPGTDFDLVSVRFEQKG